MNIKNINLENRLDIIVKYLFIKSYIENNEYEYYKILYIKHIKLWTWWIEDDKKNINEFVKNFISLINSFKEKWFNKNFPIPINSNNEILNWAHRIACCYYFWIEPIFIENNEYLWIKWDFNWFKKNNFSEEELLNILYWYTEIEKDCTIITVWPNIINKINTLKEFSEEYKIIWDLNISLKSKNNFKELIYDMYCFDWNFEPNIWVYEKAQYLSNISTSIQIIILKESSKVFFENKIKFREKFINFSGIKDKEKAKFYTFHSSDSRLESEYLIELK
jgi:hypothetical protein